jgi:hypothetical protein
MTARSGWRAAALSFVLAACAPALDWREVRVDGGLLTAQFPCRVERRIRTVALAGASQRMELAACDAGGVTFAVSYLDVADPTRVRAVLEALRDATADNVGASAPQTAPYTLRGMTPNPLAVRLRADGHRPDGTPLQARAAFFVRGMRVYQASVVGTGPAPEAVETFLSGLKFIA